MLTLRNKHVSGPIALLLSLVVTVVAAMTWGVAATGSAPSAPRAAAAATVAQTAAGELDSKIRGTTANGRTVTGSFVPLDFSKKDGKLFVRGLIRGVVHNNDGSTRTFGVMRKVRVQSINGVPIRTGTGAARAAQAAPACDILNLRLGPLDLDLLGLQVDLNRIVLDIVAQTGAGKLLGNLLCAVAGLLDSGLGGLLGRLANLLDRILGRLGLGL